MELKINPEYESLLPEMKPEEYESLRESIRSEGLHYPIIVNDEGVILDGHNRYRICKELDVEVKTAVRIFPSKLLEKKFVIEANLKRRHLNDFQKAELGMSLLEVEKELAKQRMSQGGKGGLIDPTLRGRATEKVAEKLGLSRKTFERAKTVIEKAPEELKDKVRIGKVSISKAYKEVKGKRIVPKKVEYISESGVEWCDYGINIYKGCEHNCSYCYGKKMFERGTLWKNDIEAWNKPVKREIDLEKLREEVELLEPGTIFFCSVTDAYQPMNKQLRWAREVLEVLLDSKHTIIILTKNASVEDDFDLISQFKNVEVGFTITTLDDEKAREYEPNSSPPSERIRVLKKAHEMGITTRVSLEPWILGFTDPFEIVKKLHPFVDYWWIGTYNYAGVRLEEYQKDVGKLQSLFVDLGCKYWFKAELDRVFKSNPILKRNEYQKTESQMVGSN